jgi:hypothetical protein
MKRYRALLMGFNTINSLEHILTYGQVQGQGRFPR